MGWDQRRESNREDVPLLHNPRPRPPPIGARRLPALPVARFSTTGISPPATTGVQTEEGQSQHCRVAVSDDHGAEGMRICLSGGGVARTREG
jgi:hypothetical protein